MPLPASAPATATPSAAPTWRLADAIAAAKPACDRGIPAMAAVLTGAPMQPRPTPKIV